MQLTLAGLGLEAIGNMNPASALEDELPGIAAK